MLKVKGNFDAVKAEMRLARSIVSGGIRGLKAQHKPKDKWSPYPTRVTNRINELEFKEKLFRVSKTLPVRIEGLVINYKLYSSFTKKLKDFRISVAVNDNCLEVNYWKPGTLNNGKGVLKLYDLSPYFVEFKHIPVAEFVEDGSKT